MRIYGSDLFRGSRWFRPRRDLTDDGRTLLMGGDPNLQAVDLDTGVVVDGEAVTAFVPSGDHMVAVRRDDPTALAVCRARDLAPVWIRSPGSARGRRR